MTKLRQLWLLTAIATLAVLAGGYMLMVSPQKGKAEALRVEADDQLTANRRLQTQIDMLNKQKKDLPKQQAKLAEFAGLIPPNPSLPALVRALTDAADKTGVELLSISPTLPSFAKAVDAKTGVELPGRIQGPNGTALVDIPVAMRVAGHYSNISMFFHEVEELSRAMLVGNFKLARPEGNLRESEVSTAETTDPDLLVVELGAKVMMTTKAKPAPAPVTTSSSSDENN